MTGSSSARRGLRTLREMGSLMRSQDLGRFAEQEPVWPGPRIFRHYGWEVGGRTVGTVTCQRLWDLSRCRGAVSR